MKKYGWGAMIWANDAAHDPLVNHVFGLDDMYDDNDDNWNAFDTRRACYGAAEELAQFYEEQMFLLELWLRGMDTRDDF